MSISTTNMLQRSPEVDGTFLNLMMQMENWPKHALQFELPTRKHHHVRPSSPRTNLTKRPASTMTREDVAMNALHFVIASKRRRLVCQHPRSSDSAVLNRFHVITSEDCSGHEHCALASEAISIVIAEPDLMSGSISETVDSHIACFRSARELLSLQIEALEREQEEEELLQTRVLARTNLLHV